MRNINTPLRTFQTVLSLLILASSAYVTHWYIHHTTTHSTPHETTFLLVLSALTLLPTLPYLFLNPTLSQSSAPPGKFFNKHLLLVLDLVLAALWLSGAIVVAVFIAGLKVRPHDVVRAMWWEVGLGLVNAVGFGVGGVLAGLHVMRTRGGGVVRGEKKEHERWVGQMEGLKV